MGVKMIVFWCLILGVTLLPPPELHVQAVESSTAVAPRCLREDSKKCVILALNLANPFDHVELPSLSGKNTLQIKRGHLAAFSESIANQLGTVVKLQLGPLELKKIFIKPQLLELTAGGNQIGEVEFQTGAAYYGLQILDLSANNLKNLDGFDVLANLRELHLEGNVLETIDCKVFNSMKDLEKLFLDRNRITTLKSIEPLELPALEIMSLSRNQLVNFDVSNWQLDSLTKWDVSSNKLVRIEGAPEERFPSLQMVFVAKNDWKCNWLQETLQRFNESLIQVQDRDEDCQGISPANICCVPDQSTDTAIDERLNELRKLESEGKNLKAEFEGQMAKLKNDNDSRLKALESRLKKIEESGKRRNEGSIADDGDPQKMLFQSLAEVVQKVESDLQEQQKQWTKQQLDNERVQRRLGYTILELRKSLERDCKEIAELQAKFDYLRDHVRNTLEKRERLMAEG